ncbi:hypothetical protein AXF42_Ash000153 [Apostasia shenzhenica]|uniref:CCG-binding protein 1 n=1 Tax=Apostasia shenzhenica TaxID=1088818 RepID=A0A2I0AFI7_9ASPA|nr:hypothetical protein AXF42_Ash000153 [Apostasia shenzhenica]
MLRSLVSPTSPSALLFESAGGDLCRRFPTRSSSASCCVQRTRGSVPKLEPFSRSRIDRGIKEPPFLRKSENDLTDYCSTLDGDDAYSCWKAYFELKDLESKMPREEVETFVRQSGGIKSLIDCLHGLTTMLKRSVAEKQKDVPSSSEAEMKGDFHVPDGLPKTQEELEEEEKARMPDSSFTRLLRTMGRAPAWYSQAPDHETD